MAEEMTEEKKANPRVFFDILFDSEPGLFE